VTGVANAPIYLGEPGRGNGRGWVANNNGRVGVGGDNCYGGDVSYLIAPRAWRGKDICGHKTHMANCIHIHTVKYKRVSGSRHESCLPAKIPTFFALTLLLTFYLLTLVL
jgi:hypothetical protein